MKLCLRCDWEGETRSATCPECGAPLFARREDATAATRKRRRRRATGTERTERTPRPRRGRRARADADEDVPKPQRRAFAIVPLVLIAVVATTAVVVIRSSTPRVLTATQGADLRGVLLYTAEEGQGWRLWRWDLPTWTATPGPLLDERPLELIHALDAGEGVVGLTQVGPDGHTARILRHLEDTDHAATLLAGERVAWTRSGGLAVAAEVAGSSTNGCGDLLVREFEVDRGEEELVLREPVCARVSALGRSYSTSFVTLTDEQAWRTIGVRAGDLVVSHGGLGLLGASPSGSLLLVPTGSFPLDAPQPLFRSADGSLGPRGEPEPYGVGGEGLAVHAFLGWAPASGGAYVLGTYADERGIFLVAVDGGDAVSAPVLVSPLAGANVTVTETTGAALLVTVDGRFYRARQGGLDPLDPPPDAPPPEGPILWVPSVPDSAQASVG